VCLRAEVVQRFEDACEIARFVVDDLDHEFIQKIKITLSVVAPLSKIPQSFCLLGAYIDANPVNTEVAVKKRKISTNQEALPAKKCPSAHVFKLACNNAKQISIEANAIRLIQKPVAPSKVRRSR
jgi:hypothetical protein